MRTEVLEGEVPPTLYGALLAAGGTSLRIRIFTLLAAVGLTISVPGAAQAKADVNHLVRQWAEGAQQYVDTCPLSNPVVDTPCTAYTVSYAREDTPNGGLNPDPSVPAGRAKAPFAAIALIEDVVVHPDGTADSTERAFGLTFDAIGTYDKTQLSFASVSASIPMSDGSVFGVNVAWVGDGVIHKFGNSGPESEYEGFPAQRFHDACTTGVFNDHQKYANAVATGTIGGVDIASFGYRSAYIFNNWFHWTIVTHGNCTG